MQPAAHCLVCAGRNIEMGTGRRLSVVVPCFNEAQGLAELHRRASAVCKQVAGDDYEIVLVNDGSRDDTWRMMAVLAVRDPHIVAVNLTRNYGHQVALTAGLDHCRGERILIIDADLQDPPELLPQMQSLMDQGADVVYGQRRSRRGETRFKKTLTSLYYRLLRQLVDIDIPLDTGDFRLISRRVLDVLKSMPERTRFIRGMVSWMGLKQVPLVYDRDPRFAGETGYPLRKLIALALDGITGFSVMPLRIASYIGMVTGVVGLGMLLYTMGGWLFANAPVGWASTTTIILVIGSAQLMVLGIVGEYLGRLYLESKHRPLYLIDTVLAQEAALAPQSGMQNKASHSGRQDPRNAVA
jgi:glycosyltransferase involved in cell wall biosynthesis